MTITTRFAPSPSGRLHVGNARTALVNWLCTRADHGRFILRLDDTDAARSTAAFARAIEADLAWLGLDWDEHHRQSERLAHYQLAFETLRRAGRVYRCYETPEELATRRKAARARGRPPIYDRAGRRLSEAERRHYEAAGRRPHWRFALHDAEIGWCDQIQGEKRFAGAKLSDPVVLRADASPTYTLASVVDDVELAVTDVIRGEDHVANTAVQIQIIEALGARPPRFAHLPLLVDAAGRALAKRLASLRLKDLRAAGLEPMAINCALAALGTPEAPRLTLRLQDLLEDFALERLGRAPPRFDPEALWRVNRQLLKAMPYEDARPRLAALGLETADQGFWLAVRDNLVKLADAVEWWRVCHQPTAPLVEDPVYLALAADLLPVGELDEAAFLDWVQALKDASGRKGRALFQPLRLALTGREHGPELKHLLPIIGRERAARRLRGELA